MKTFKTFLPIFNGFYSTIFEPDGEDQEIDDINGQRESKGLKPITFDDCKFDYDEYRKEVCIDVTKYIEFELKQLNLITSIKFENLYSPKEYNFDTDSINIEIDLTEDNIKEIKKFLYDNIEDYKSYLHEQYTSCSGFISFNPNTLDGWQEITKDFTDYSEKMHYLGSVLEFICQMNELNTESMYDQLTDCNLHATNYTELIGE